MKLKMFSTADWHYSKERQKDFWKSAEFFYTQAKKENPDLIVIAGDLSDRAVYNTRSAGFDQFIDYIKSLLDISPIAAVYGTPTHDVPGSLEVFERIKAKNSFTILRPGNAYFFSSENKINLNPKLNGDEDRLIILGVPEPGKNWLLANNEGLSSEEATEAVNCGMKNFLNGLATFRKQYPQLPCLLVYHGAVAGARLSDTQVLPAGGIELGFHDLERIEADYYSCGHIHMRQNISFIPGGYEGSIYPKTWGETDKKAFSIVELEKSEESSLFSNAEFTVNRKEVVFPHAPMKKVTCSWPKLPEITDYKDFRVWIKIMVEKSRRGEVDTEKLLEKIISNGADPDSRITREVITEETTRASEIIEKKTLFDKVEVWAKNTEIKLLPGIEDKCIELEKELHEKGLTHIKRHLKLDSVSLKGAIGIWKGLEKDFIEIDFSMFNPGTIALIGDNGSGKSTLIKNCNPFSKPIDGIDGKDVFQNHFFLRDSHSITYWTDCLTGLRYKAVKLIDGKNKTGKTEFFLYKSEGSDWVPYNDEQTGRKEGYDKAVSEVFGTPEMFKKSVYTSQAGAELPASNKDKKEFFNELLGNDYLEDICTTTKQKSKELENLLLKDEGHLEVLSGYEEKLPDLKSRLLQLEKEKDEKVKAQQELEKELIEKEGLVKKLREEHVENERLNEQISVLAGNIQDNEDKIKELERQIHSLEETQKRVPEAEKAVAEYENQSIKKQNLEKDKNAVVSEITELQKKLIIEEKSVHDRKRENEIEITSLENKIQNNEYSITEGLKEISHLHESSELIKKPCENCGYIKDSVKKTIEEYSIKSQNISEECQALRIAITNQKAELDQLKEKNISEEKLESLRSEVDSSTFRLQDLEKEIELIPLDSKIDYWWEILKQAETARTEISSKGNQITDLKKENQEKSASLLEKRGRYDLFLSDELEASESELTSLQKQNTDLSRAITEILGDIKHITSEIETAEKSAKDFRELLKGIENRKNEKLEWDLLTRAFSHNGIQALELDALCPAIAASANNLLSDTYGSRFQIEFRTVRESGSGKNMKQIEDFQIFVYDAEEKNPDLQYQNLMTMSGGERVWIMKALFDAFSYVREINTGLKYLTIFLDEADGALSPEKKHLYLKMVDAAQRQSGRIHTIIITHDQVIQESAGERILMHELGKLGEEAA